MLDQVKGYINEMAVRLEDEDTRISSLAKLFFHELSKKGFPPVLLIFFIYTSKFKFHVAIMYWGPYMFMIALTLE